MDDISWAYSSCVKVFLSLRSAPAQKLEFTALAIMTALAPPSRPHLDGMFAFAIYHDERRELVLASDLFGEARRHGCSAGGRLVFASDIRAMEARPDLGAPDAAALTRRADAPIDRSFFAGINRLPGGPRETAADARPAGGGCRRRSSVDRWHVAPSPRYGAGRPRVRRAELGVRREDGADRRRRRRSRRRRAQKSGFSPNGSRAQTSSLPLVVPDREREHAVEAVERALPHSRPRVQEHLAVALGDERVPEPAARRAARGSCRSRR